MKLFFTGDVALNNLNIAKENPFHRISNILNESDSTIISFDCSIGNPPSGKWDRTYLTCPEAGLNWIESLPHPVLNLATNHATDGGIEGLISSFQKFNQRGIKFFGAGNDILSAKQPFLIEDKKTNTRAAIIACVTKNSSPTCVAGSSNEGPNPYQFECLVNQANQLRKENDFVILCIHWGKELLDYPLPEERESALQLLNSFEVIIGNHSHVVRGSYQVNEKHIYFSLGNTLFDDLRDSSGKVTFPQAPRNKLGLILQIELDKQKKIKVTPISTKQNGHEVWLDRDNSALRMMDKNSINLYFSENEYQIAYNKHLNWFNRFGYIFQYRFKAYGLIGSLLYLSRRK